MKSTFSTPDEDQSKQTPSTSYVYDGTEVKMTGRTASRTVKLSSKQFNDVLIEIEPIDKMGPTWKKWVKKTDLYEVNSG